MNATRTVAAVDMGAESGRVVTVDFDGTRFDLTVHHRFTHEPVPRDGILRWDFDTIIEGIRTGLGTVSRTARGAESVGVDAWGVDYGLLDGSGQLVDLPTCYRDPRQVEAMHEAIAILGRDRIYRATGVQIIAINTVFGLRADVTGSSGRLDKARTLLMMPDLLHHELCGSTVAEFTEVSTSGAFDMARNRWADELLADLGVPSRLLPEVVPPGTDLGGLIGATGSLRGARVITPATHDTASAVVGTPLASPDAVYISSGTWSLIGVEVPAPCVSEATLRANLTNEGGYGGRIRLLRNVMGLWILQECRRAWHDEGRSLDYEQ
ncbi:MAG TPA: FGGY family carbohydrate kinase, partial [Marmoricola sp.]